MNKKGQLFLSIVLGLGFFILGILMINYIGPEVTLVSASDQLDCQNVTAISDGRKLTCVVAYSTVPLFILTIISIVGGIIAAKFLV